MLFYNATYSCRLTLYSCIVIPNTFERGSCWTQVIMNCIILLQLIKNTSPSLIQHYDRLCYMGSDNGCTGGHNLASDSQRHGRDVRRLFNCLFFCVHLFIIPHRAPHSLRVLHMSTHVPSHSNKDPRMQSYTETSAAV